MSERNIPEFGGDPVLGPLYEAVTEAESMLDDFAIGINYADGADQQVCAQIREAWDAIMERLGRVEQLLAALPMPEREAEPAPEPQWRTRSCSVKGCTQRAAHQMAPHRSLFYLCAEHHAAGHAARSEVTMDGEIPDDG